MRFLILRLLTHSELGMFHEYRRQGKEGSKQRALNFDWDVVDRVFPAAKDTARIEMDLKFDTDTGVRQKRHWLKRQEKNWRLEGNCPSDKCYHFVEPGCLFAMQVNAGTKPATGSWAVFPREHAVTTAILSDGESSRLSSSAMIALHDEEAAHSWEVLADRRPDLFSAKKKEHIVIERRKQNSVRSGKELAPDAARLVEILASVGHNLPSAIADLVDNAISADATRVDITFGPPDAGHGRWLAIADNGKGMDEQALAEAMRIGSSTEYEGNSLGKYGYGLKGASWSQTKVFTVVTQKAGLPVHHLTWDVKDMQGWIAKSEPLDEWEEAATAIALHGTVVLWKDMRPPEAASSLRKLDPYSNEVMHLERHLALVFHRFIEGKAVGRKAVVISINRTPVAANNPVGHPLTVQYDRKTIRIPTETGTGTSHVQAFLLPSEDELTQHHTANSANPREAIDRIGLYGKRNETQGLFIYRNDRLIKWGGWHQMWETNDEKTKLARVTVDFGKDLDEALKINISKQLVQLPQQLQAEIKKLADPARKDSQKKYRPGGTSAPKPPRGAAPPTPGGPVTARPAPAPVPGSSPPAPPAATPFPVRSAPPVVASTVKTEKFLWKASTSLTGTRDLQISGLEPKLTALVDQIRQDAQAVSLLWEFLEALDKYDVQKLVIASKGS